MICRIGSSGSDSPAGLKSLIRNLKGETEINAISSALEQTGWNRRKAALLLNISYRGEKGKTTGYYVPQGAEEATREGVAAWQKLQACLRQLAELNKERNLLRAHQVARPMKGWASLALIAGLILCLLLSLGPQAGLNSQPPVDRSGTCGSKLPASNFPLPWVVASTTFHSAVPASRESVVLDGALTTRALGPPGRDTYRPPGTTKWLGHLSARPPGQSNNRYPSSENFLLSLSAKL